MILNSRAARAKVLAVALLCAFSAPSMAKLVIGTADNGHCFAINFPGVGQQVTIYDLGVLPSGACHLLSNLLT